MTKQFSALLSGLLLGTPALASENAVTRLDLTSSWVGPIALFVFVAAYTLVILEERLHLRKSKPVLLAAALIWVLVALGYNQHGIPHMVEQAIRHDFLEYAELFFFLLVAMTYINAMLERGVFDELRAWLVSRGFGYRSLFWLTGFLAFFISPVADNLTTALIMCAVVMAVGEGQPRFVAICCTNIVVAANAGGAFSPFGDITTLMVWQKGIVEFGQFFAAVHPLTGQFRRACSHHAVRPARGQAPGRPRGRAAPEVRGHFDRSTVCRHHRHGGLFPQFPAYTPGLRDDGGAGVPAVLRLLPEPEIQGVGLDHRAGPAGNRRSL